MKKNLLAMFALSGYCAAASESSDPTAGGGQVQQAQAKPADDNDFELPAKGAEGAACGLGDGASCEACQ